MRMDEVKGEGATRTTQQKTVLEVGGDLVRLDEHGYLLDPDQWSRTVTERMAEADGVELTDDHWLLIDFLHRFYREFEMAPEMPILARNLCKDQHDCRWTRRYVNQLFPHGAKTACRYAGLPTPVGRSCG
jgi:TusE/DsrC/DsvC family sulfur relay protein